MVLIASKLQESHIAKDIAKAPIHPGPLGHGAFLPQTVEPEELFHDYYLHLGSKEFLLE